MGNSQLFRYGSGLIEAKYQRGEQWATTQLQRAIDLADAAPLTSGIMKEILQYEFGILWNGEIRPS